jgi:pimeloyl-ACP methyl ester carboxylesterase
VALLFLHAFPLSRRFWEPQIATLSPSFRCIAPDLAGFGDSQVPLPGQTSRMSDFAADARALLDHLGIDRAVLCGCSMGGYAALAFAADFPERLAGLVLADSRAGADAPPGREGRLAMAERVMPEGTGFVAESMIPKLLGRTSHERRPELRAWLEREIATAPPAGIAAAQRGMAERPDRADLLPRLTVPALILVGEEDEITPPEESHRMARAIPGARTAVLPEAGHLASLERPDAFNRALDEFLREGSIS